MLFPALPTLDHLWAVSKKDSELFLPAGLVTRPDQGYVTRGRKRPPDGIVSGKRLAWSDRNGDGKPDEDEFTYPADGVPRGQPSYNVWVDAKGGIWEPQARAGLRHLPLRALSEEGVPEYRLEDQVYFERPPEFLTVMRAIYLPDTDTMMLTGETWAHPANGREHWGQAGREIICYQEWSTAARRVAWRAPFPDGATNIKALTVAPKSRLLLAGEMETSCIFLYDLDSGRMIGMIEPDESVVGSVAWIDIDSGIRPFTRANGELLVIAECVWGQKQLVYRINPKDLERARSRAKNRS